MGIELLIFLPLPFINAWWDAVHGEENHFRSWLIRGAAIVGLSFAISFLFPNPWPEITNSSWWLYFLIGATTEWMLFDYLYNWFTGNKWTYIGQEAAHKDDWTWKIYKAMEKAPEIVLTVKVFLWVVALSLYYQLDLL